MPDGLAGTRPNIIFVLADDLSYKDLSCLGQEQFQTPNLDRLCQQGLRFDEAYAGAPECAPSRASLMTGMHMGHCTVRNNESARGQDHLRAADVTVAERLKEAGYATGTVGKWGIGLPGTEGVPYKKGFDMSFGFYDQKRAHTYYPHFLYHKKTPIAYPENFGFDIERNYQHTHEPKGLHTYDDRGRLLPDGVKEPLVARNSEDLCFKKATEFICANAGQSFFLYYSTQLPHGPCITPNLGEYKDKPWGQKHQEWAGMVTHLDRHVGKIMDLLEELGIADNTILFFASDNGYSHWGYMGRKPYEDDPLFRNKGPWKGGKFISWDGGVRVPMFVTWPGRIEPGTTDRLVVLYDFFETACELAGIDATPNDGISFLPLLEGRDDEQAPHEFLYWENGCHAPHAQAVRMRNWFAWREHPEQVVQLWDVNEDVACERDLATERPDVVDEVLGIFEREHVDSEWYLNPGETKEQFQTKRDRAQRENCLQPSVTGNTERRGEPRPD